MRVKRRYTHADIAALQSGPIRDDDPYLDNRRDWLPYARRVEAHDAQTRVLIRERCEMERLQHSDSIVELLDRWHHLEQLDDPAAKQRFLEPVIWAVQRDPNKAEAKLVFLLIACAPVEHGVAKEFVHVRSGLDARPAGPASDWRRREEASRLHEIDHQQMLDVVRVAMLEALHAYPSPPPDRLFPWLRATVAHGALTQLKRELPEILTTSRTAVEASAMQEALAGLSVFEAPRMREAAGRAAWRREIDMRSVFAIAQEYYRHGEVRKTCAAAVGRLGVRQREVIRALFFEGVLPRELAARRKVTRSTVYNHKSQALRRLENDDVFFAALCELGQVRDRARVLELRRRYPDGRLPDGRRIVAIAS